MYQNFVENFQIFLVKKLYENNKQMNQIKKQMKEAAGVKKPPKKVYSLKLDILDSKRGLQKHQSNSSNNLPNSRLSKQDIRLNNKMSSKDIKQETEVTKEVEQTARPIQFEQATSTESHQVNQKSQGEVEKKRVSEASKKKQNKVKQKGKKKSIKKKKPVSKKRQRRTGGEIYDMICHYEQYLYQLTWQELDPEIFKQNLRPDVVWFLFSHQYFPKDFVIKKIERNLIKDQVPYKVLEENYRKRLNPILKNLLKKQGNLHERHLISQQKSNWQDQFDSYNEEMESYSCLKGKRSLKQYDLIFLLKMRNKMIKFQENIKNGSFEGVEQNLEEFTMNSCLIDLHSRFVTLQNYQNTILEQAKIKKLEDYNISQFFCRDYEGKVNSTTKSIFYNRIHSKDILYNIKSFFPIEHNMISEMEEKLRQNKTKNIEKFKNYQPIFTKKVLNHNDMICYVCNSPDYNDQNQIVFCSLCNLSVHQQCYQIKKIPKEDWVCNLCKNYGINGRMKSCFLCSCYGGAMKNSHITIKEEIIQDFNQNYCQSMGEVFTPKNFDWKAYLQHNNQKALYDVYAMNFKFQEQELVNAPKDKQLWFHYSCLLFNKKIEIQENGSFSLQKLKKKNFEEMCSICRTSMGCVVSCSVSNCSYKFHVECARRGKLTMENKDYRKGTMNIFCPDHSPLSIRKNLLMEEKRTRDTIVKFSKNLKRFLLQKEINLSEFSVKKDKDQNNEKDDIKVSYKELIEFFDEDSKRLYREVSEQVKYKKDYQLIVTLNKFQGEHYQIQSVKKPKKDQVNYLIPHNSMVWKKIQKQWVVDAHQLFNSYQKLISNLKFLYKNRENVLIPKESVGNGNAEFQANEEGFGSEKYCICKKEWKGELMVSCERCDEWFHSECLGLGKLNDVELNNHQIYCEDCKNSFFQDYRFPIEQLFKDEITIPCKSFKWKLAKPLQEILSQNKEKILFFRDYKNIKRKKKFKKKIVPQINIGKLIEEKQKTQEINRVDETIKPLLPEKIQLEHQTPLIPTQLPSLQSQSQL